MLYEWFSNPMIVGFDAPTFFNSSLKPTIFLSTTDGLFFIITYHVARFCF